MNISSLAEMNIEAVNYVISAKDVSADAIKTATSGIKKFEADTKTVTDRMSSHWESYKSSYIKATAAIAIATATMMKVWSMAKIGAQFEEQRGILDNLAKKYSMTADSIVSSMEKASEGLVARADLMQVALGGIAKGLKPEQLINLAGAANILGDAVGKNATTALKELTEALESGRARGLKTYLGTTLDLKSAFGDLESKMTDVEKAQAMYSLTMITATRLQGQQVKAVDDAADKMDRLEAKWNNINLAAARYFKTVVVGLIDMAKGDLYKPPGFKTSIYPGPPGSPMAGLPGPMGEGVTLRYDPSEDKKIKAYQAQIDALKKILQGREDEKKAVKDAGAQAEWRKNQAIQWAREETEAKIKENQAMVKDMEETTKKIFEEREKYQNYRFNREEDLRKYLEDTDKKLIERAKATNAEMIRLVELREEAIRIIERRKIEVEEMYQSIYTQVGEEAPGYALIRQGLSLQDELIKTTFQRRETEAFDHWMKIAEYARQGKATEAEYLQAYDAYNLASQAKTESMRLNSTLSYLSIAQGALQAYAAFSGKQNMAMFLVAKAIAIASAIVQGHLAAMAAAASSAIWGGPAAAAAAYKSMIILTYINAALMAAVAIGQMSSGSAAVGGGMTTTPTGGLAYPVTTYPSEAAKPERPAPIIHITVLGNIVDQGQFVRDIIPEIKKAYSDDVH